MENRIEIKVIGKAASGKTTISREIVDVLRKHGFDVEWNVKPDFQNENELRDRVQNHQFRLGVLHGKGTKIVVKEEHHIIRFI
jgi:molybdopterin-guanine dinucleotide biosynthesis protein